MEKFRKLGITEEILISLKKLGFEKPTEIQEKAIPEVLAGKDIIAGSATGSGKTLAFGVGIIQDLVPGNGIQALILTPTRELAEQILNAMKTFSKAKPAKISSIYGGVSINPQFKALEKAEIVVGTPGRLLDHLERGTIDLTHIKHLVLDEADRMLDMGFIDDVTRIVSQCPKEKQMLLFSATIPPEIEHLSKRFMNNPTRIKAETFVDPSKLRQVYYDSKDNEKISIMVHLLKEEHPGLTMIFCNTRRDVDFVAKNLSLNGVDAIPIHGGHTQARRSETMRKFKSENVSALVCTDVAARGLDIPKVSHVYNYNIPNDSKEYIHRIGRTARAGKNGKVINLIGDRDHENFGRVLNDYDVKIKKEPKPDAASVKIIKPNARGNGRAGPRYSRGGAGRGPSRGGSRGPPRSHGQSRGRSRSGSRSSDSYSGVKAGLSRSERNKLNQ